VKSVPKDFRQNSPKVPSTVPGQVEWLAVAKTWQRQGIGEILMVEAMQHALIENAGLSVYSSMPSDEAAKTYYQRFGFVSLEETPLNCSCHCPPSGSPGA